MRIELRGASKRFGRASALSAIDLSVASGERVALVGPNGSGKSTLIRALLGLIDCDGEVLLDGRSPYVDRVELARRFAYVPQIAPALGATVGEVVALVSTTRELEPARVRDVAAMLDLDLASVAAQVFRTMSGGMKQKLLLAIAFAARPRLLVLDEPTASLDATSRARFFELCAALDADVTLLLCSHRVDELSQLAHRVVSLEDGRITHDGPALGYLGSAAGQGVA